MRCYIHSILLFYVNEIPDWGQYSDDFGAVLKQSLVVLMAKSRWPLEETLPTSHIHSTSCMQQAIDWALQESSFRRSESYMLLMTMRYYDFGMEVSLWLN